MAQDQTANTRLIPADVIYAIEEIRAVLAEARSVEDMPGTPDTGILALADVVGLVGGILDDLEERSPSKVETREARQLRLGTSVNRPN